jgi:hypothetical protein
MKRCLYFQRPIKKQNWQTRRLGKCSKPSDPNQYMSTSVIRVRVARNSTHQNHRFRPKHNLLLLNRLLKFNSHFSSLYNPLPQLNSRDKRITSPRDPGTKFGVEGTRIGEVAPTLLATRAEEGAGASDASALPSEPPSHPIPFRAPPQNLPHRPTVQGPVGGRLTRYWEVWAQKGMSAEVVEILRWGARIEFWRKPTLVFSPTNSSDSKSKDCIIQQQSPYFQKRP